MTRILIADDESGNLEIAMIACRAAGYSVQAAGDGEEVLAALRESGPFDLLLLDVQMPRLDGLALTRRLRESREFAALPIIGVTGLAWPQQLAACRQAGMDAVQAKPYRIQALRALIDEVLERTRLRAQPETGPEPPR